MVAPKVLISAGMPGAGKEEFLIALRHLGIPFVRMGDTVRDEKRRQSSQLPTGEFAHQERSKHGDGVWAFKTMERLDDRLTIIDGCRSIAEVNAFRNALGDSLCVIAIHSDPATRFQRLVGRGREDAPSSIEEFRSRDEREMEWGLAKVIALADVMIVNDCSLEEFHQRCLRAVEEAMRP